MLLPKYSYLWSYADNQIRQLGYVINNPSKNLFLKNIGLLLTSVSQKIMLA